MVPLVGIVGVSMFVAGCGVTTLSPWGYADSFLQAKDAAAAGDARAVARILPYLSRQHVQTLVQDIQRGSIPFHVPVLRVLQDGGLGGLLPSMVDSAFENPKIAAAALADPGFAAAMLREWRRAPPERDTQFWERARAVVVLLVEADDAAALGVLKELLHTTRETAVSKAQVLDPVALYGYQQFILDCIRDHRHNLLSTVVSGTVVWDPALLAAAVKTAIDHNNVEALALLSSYADLSDKDCEVVLQVLVGALNRGHEPRHATRAIQRVISRGESRLLVDRLRPECKHPFVQALLHGPEAPKDLEFLETIKTHVDGTWHPAGAFSDKPPIVGWGALKKLVQEQARLPADLWSALLVRAARDGDMANMRFVIQHGSLTTADFEQAATAVAAKPAHGVLYIMELWNASGHRQSVLKGAIVAAAGAGHTAMLKSCIVAWESRWGWDPVASSPFKSLAIAATTMWGRAAFTADRAQAVQMLLAKGPIKDEPYDRPWC